MDAPSSRPRPADPPAAGSLGWWGARSRLDPLAAVLDPSDVRGRKNRVIDATHHAALRRALAGARLGRTLDFGCGTGRLTELLAPLSSAVTGVDISEPMIETARRLHGGAGREFLAYDGERLPFDDGAFDTVVSALVLQMYCDDPPRFRALVEDLARVLRPGGSHWLVERAAPAGGDAWTRERWGDELGACGLRLERVTPVRHGAPGPIARVAGLRVVPGLAVAPLAAADAAVTARRGLRAPYTECLMRATRA